MDKSQITAIVLAGGAATRMGGKDKGLLPFRDATLVEKVIDRIAPQCGDLIVSANRNQEHYRQLGYEVIGDDIAGFCGPLAGISACLNAIKTPYAVVVPCDSPFIASDHVERLSKAFTENQGLVCASARAQGKCQPVFMMVRKDAQGSMREFLSRGNRKVRQWLEENGVYWVDFERMDFFENINTPEELSLSQ